MAALAAAAALAGKATDKHRQFAKVDFVPSLPKKC